MQRLDGRRRAPFFDERFYTENTLETHARRRHRFESAAAEAHFAPTEAPRTWILDFFTAEALHSLVSARKQLPAVAHLFRAAGCAEAFPYDEISTLLHDVSLEAQDPVGIRLERGLPKRARRRARAFAGERLAKTRAWQARLAQSWEVYARRYGWDPKDATIRQFEGFLSVYARNHRYRTVVNLCSALSNYFLASNVVDLTRTEKVRDFLTVLARKDAETSKYRPLFAEDLREIVKGLDCRPLDLRDRVICLLNYYGAMFCTELSALTTDVQVLQDRILVTLEGRIVSIGAVDDPELDVRLWVQRLLKTLPPGPLFPMRDPRGDWMPTALPSNQIARIIRGVARRAGIRVPRTSLAFRKGFAIRVSRAVGPIHTAKHMRLKRTASLEIHTGVRRGKRTRAKRFGWPQILSIRRGRQ